jgi:hypothetical protein
MSDEFENDEILTRLRGEDPASRLDETHPEAPGERDAVRRRAVRLLEGNDRPRRRPNLSSIRPRLAVGAALLALALGVALILIIGGSSSGPAPALAIDKDQRWVTLTLKDPSASDEEMNQELAAAGIDRVRVKSVPGPPKEQLHPFWGLDSVGTWAGYVELGPRCQGGVSHFGYDVDIPISTPYNRANRHGAEDLFDLTLPRRSGALSAQEVGTPFSRSTVRLPTDSVDDPRNAAKVLVPVRPRSPDDAPDANDIGADQLAALGGVPGEYGEAINDGRTSCSDFGLKPLPKPTYTFPPPGGGWVVLHLSGTEAGASRMNRELKTGGIDGTVRLIPARAEEVGHYLGFERMPPLPKHSHGVGKRIDIAFPIAPPGHTKPEPNKLALRRSAFNAFPQARWIFYVGRAPRAGEKPQVMTLSGPQNADAALKAGCPGAPIQISPGGRKKCGSGVFRLQVPAP